MTIIRNRAQCKLCKDIIESVHVHDFKFCKCQEIAVDGGRSYLKRSARDMDNIIELSEYMRNGVVKAAGVPKTKKVDKITEKA